MSLKAKMESSEKKGDCLSACLPVCLTGSELSGNQQLEDAGRAGESVSEKEKYT